MRSLNRVIIVGARSGSVILADNSLDSMVFARSRGDGSLSAAVRKRKFLSPPPKVLDSTRRRRRRRHSRRENVIFLVAGEKKVYARSAGLLIKNLGRMNYSTKGRGEEAGYFQSRRRRASGDEQPSTKFFRRRIFAV